MCVGRVRAGERWVQRGTWVRWRRASDAVEPVGISRHTSARRACHFSSLPGVFFITHPGAGRSARPPEPVLTSWTQPLRQLRVAPPVRSEPATYPRRPRQAAAARTIPTVPCPSARLSNSRAHVDAHSRGLVGCAERVSCQPCARVFSTDFARDRWRPPLLRRIRHLPKLRFNSLSERAPTVRNEPVACSLCASRPMPLMPCGTPSSSPAPGYRIMSIRRTMPSCVPTPAPLRA